MWTKRSLSQTAMSMRAIDGHGALITTPAPTPNDDEILIKVAYAGINRADILQRQGRYPLPDDASPILGLEVSGTIAAVGKHAIGWSEGEPVCALVNGGGYAEYVVAKQELMFPLPPRLSLQQAAAIPEAAMTAWMALMDEARLRDGETLLLHGGASGVGIFMVQLASLLGAKVIASVGSAEKAALVEAHGGIAIIHTEHNVADEIQRLTENRGVDVIIDILGGPKLNEHIGLLRQGGRLVLLAFLQGNEAESVKLSRFLTRQLRMSGCALRNKSSAEKARLMEAVRKRILPYIITDAIRPVIDRVFPLEEVEAAHNHMQERLHCGKILLEVAANPTT
jgi:NADPH2:quinone reductase